METGYSKRDHDDLDWELGWLTERFVCFLECQNKFCGEIVAVSGGVRRETHEQYDELIGAVVTFNPVYLSPVAIHPAPPLFRVSQNLSKECAEHLGKAFQLLWVDPASCANRIRIFVEHLLDQLGITRSGTDDKGKEHHLKLFRRIDLLEAERPGHKKTFDALRNVGNYGSHSGKAKYETLIDCFEILEEVLKDLVDGRRARLDKITENLSMKGVDL